MGQRLLRREPVHEAAEDRAVDAAQPVAGHPGAGAGQPGRLVLEALHRGQQHPGPGQDELAERGRAGAAPVALEQRAAEGPFDALELCGEGRLGQAEL